jgi:hypothetical protein
MLELAQEEKRRRTATHAPADVDRRQEGNAGTPRRLYGADRVDEVDWIRQGSIRADLAQSGARRSAGYPERAWRARYCLARRTRLHRTVIRLRSFDHYAA